MTEAHGSFLSGSVTGPGALLPPLLCSTGALLILWVQTREPIPRRTVMLLPTPGFVKPEAERHRRMTYSAPLRLRAPAGGGLPFRCFFTLRGLSPGPSGPDERDLNGFLPVGRAWAAPSGDGLSGPPSPRSANGLRGLSPGPSALGVRGL